MRTDPREACANETEKLGWALIHDLVAHPFMALTGYSQLSLRFHDWTSLKSWPRISGAFGQIIRVKSRFGILVVTKLNVGFYSIKHFSIEHTFVTNAHDPIEAVEKAEVWFQILSDEFGGIYTRR